MTTAGCTTSAIRVCNCQCHRYEGIYHVRPCCTQCPTCHMRVTELCADAVFKRVGDGPRYPAPSEEPN